MDFLGARRRLGPRLDEDTVRVASLSETSATESSSSLMASDGVEGVAGSRKHSCSGSLNLTTGSSEGAAARAVPARTRGI